MKRTLILTVALLFGCSHGASSSSGTASAPSTAAASDQTAVVPPSELTGEQIRMLQRALSDRGFALDTTGLYDEKTQTALTDFQRARGLPATGNLNRPTVEALGLDPRDVLPVRGTSSSGAQPQSSGMSGTGAYPGTTASPDQAKSQEDSNPPSEANPHAPDAASGTGSSPDSSSSSPSSNEPPPATSPSR